MRQDRIMPSCMSCMIGPAGRAATCATTRYAASPFSGTTW